MNSKVKGILTVTGLCVALGIEALSSIQIGKVNLKVLNLTQNTHKLTIRMTPKLQPKKTSIPYLPPPLWPSISPIPMSYPTCVMASY